MGYELAKAAYYRGAEVVLVSGKTHLEPPIGIKTIVVSSAQEMFEEVKNQAQHADIVIKAAAVADFTPQMSASEKMKKKDSLEWSLPLKRTTDILAYLGEHKKTNQKICGFSMETQNLLENSRKKLEKKHADMIVANHLKEEGAGFGVDTNIVTIITKDQEIPLEKMSKESVAHHILDELLAQ